jgi:glycosyltransferase involved in cell wall biosynthesis
MAPRILYIAPYPNAFVRKDLAFLRRHYEVQSPEGDWKENRQLPLRLAAQFFWLLRRLPGARAVFVMLGGWWALLPALLGRAFGKPVYIILAGADTVAFPAIDYGSLRKPLLRRVLGLSYRLATRLLPVHEALMGSDYHYDSQMPAQQGVKSFFPRLRTPFTPCYFGFDAEFWQRTHAVKEENTFITIAAMDNLVRMRVKGVDLILEAARQLPGFSFTIVGFGRKGALAEVEVPPNVRLIGFTPREGLRDLLSASRFYLQVSLSEGFPNALCEAMLCECIPIGSEVTSVPFIIGDTGLTLPQRDAGLLAELLRKAAALPDPEALGRAARQRVATEFTEERREQVFRHLIETGEAPAP